MKIKSILIIALVIGLIGLIGIINSKYGIISVNSFGEGDAPVEQVTPDEKKVQQLVDKVTKFTMKEYGDVILEDSLVFNGNTEVICKDSKYTYAIDDQSHSIQFMFLTKIHEGENLGKITASEEDSTKYSEKTAGKIISKLNWKLKDFDVSSNESYSDGVFAGYDIAYKEIASNGLKTGNEVVLTMHNDIPSVIYIRYGDRDLAENTIINTSKEDSVDIAIEGIKEKYNNPNIDVSSSDIRVDSGYDNDMKRIVWKVEIRDIPLGEEYLGGVRYNIDVETGATLFTDDYLTLKN